MKNKNFGQLPAAIISLKRKRNNHFAKKSIEKFIDASLFSHEKPRKIIYVKNIKKNKLNKINRKFYLNNYSNKFLHL